MKSKITLFVITLMYGAYALAGGEPQQGVPWQELEKKERALGLKEVVPSPFSYKDWSTKIYRYDGGALHQLIDLDAVTIGYSYVDSAGNTTYYDPYMKITKYEPTKRIPQTALSLQEQSALRVATEVLEALVEEREVQLKEVELEGVEGRVHCAILEELLNENFDPTVIKILQKNLALCRLLDAFKGLAKNEPAAFSIAEQIINTTVGRTEEDVLNPDTTVKGQSLLAIILEKALKAENNDSFRKMLHLAQMFISKGTAIGHNEHRLLNQTPEVLRGSKPTRKLKDYIQEFYKQTIQEQ
jgi:hypothetical protein